MKKIYCYVCDKHVDATIKEQLIKTEIKGINICYAGSIAYCKECGSELYIPYLSDENTEKVYKSLTKPNCMNCRWHDDCICVVCEEGLTVVCNLKHEHVNKNDFCEIFEFNPTRYKN